MSIFALIIRILMIFELITITAIAEVTINDTPQTYRSYIDNSYGFYKIRSVTPNIDIQYDVSTRTLTINQGDTVVWINDAETNVPFTIISDENLWTENDKDAYLAYSNKQFGYTFEISGQYTFHLKEYPSVKQTIIVNSVDNYPTPTPTIIATPIPTLIITPIITSSPIPTTNSTPQIIKETPSSISNEISKIELGPKNIISIIVALLSIFITYRFSK